MKQFVSLLLLNLVAVFGQPIFGPLTAQFASSPMSIPLDTYGKCWFRFDWEDVIKKVKLYAIVTQFNIFNGKLSVKRVYCHLCLRIEKLNAFWCIFKEGNLI